MQKWEYIIIEKATGMIGSGIFNSGMAKKKNLAILTM